MGNPPVPMGSATTHQTPPQDASDWRVRLRDKQKAQSCVWTSNSAFPVIDHDAAGLYHYENSLDL